MQQFRYFVACFRFFVASFSFRSETQKHHHSDSHARGPPQPQATQNELHSIESYNHSVLFSCVFIATKVGNRSGCRRRRTVHGRACGGCLRQGGRDSTLCFWSTTVHHREHRHPVSLLSPPWGVSVVHRPVSSTPSKAFNRGPDAMLSTALLPPRPTIHPPLASPRR